MVAERIWHFVKERFARQQIARTFLLLAMIIAAALWFTQHAGWLKLIAALVMMGVSCQATWNLYAIPWRNSVNRILNVGALALIFSADSLAALTGCGEHRLFMLGFMLMVGWLLSDVVLRRYSAKA